MVTFFLVINNDEIAVFHYFPEGREESGYGVITIFKQEERIEVTKLAAEDFEYHISKEEDDAMRDSVNEMRAKEGEPLLTNEEWKPFPPEGIDMTFYASHAISRIVEAYNKGVLLDYGKSAWY